mmetsp:Transcript_362/g.592  ORF Transcript_362/g.592 Transcript_362/m.592 type:complete len:120 (+) Transcript_362:756-1115(+)
MMSLDDDDDDDDDDDVLVDLGTTKEILQYMTNYSRSMPNAIPNKELAMEELSQRNYIFLFANVHDWNLKEEEQVPIQLHPQPQSQPQLLVEKNGHVRSMAHCQPFHTLLLERMTGIHHH